MKLEFPKVHKIINLAEYALEMDPGQIHVWVNVPRRILDQVDELTGKPDDAVWPWLVEVWGPDWTVEDIKTLFEHCRENDPQLWIWLLTKTLDHLYSYRAGIKKV